MLQTSDGVPVTGTDFQTTYDHVLRELRGDAQHLLQRIDSAISQLQPEAETGCRTFAVFDLMCSIARNDQTDPLGPLHDMAERNVGADIAQREAFVEHHFGVLVWFHLKSSPTMWTETDNFNADTDCSYQQFDKTYVECAL